MSIVVDRRRCLAEALGAGVLVATVVGSGIMATELTDDVGVQLLLNAVATVLVLGVLICVLGPISGAHFNPVVTLIELARGEMARAEALAYLALQVIGAIAGAMLADIMFGLPAWSISDRMRSGWGIWLGEALATAGLVLVIGVLTRTGRGRLGALVVPAWIGAAYFFTSSTSFANPAVTVGRAFSDSFAGIAPSSVAPFIAFQLLGALLGAVLTQVLCPRIHPPPLDLPEAVHDNAR